VHSKHHATALKWSDTLPLPAAGHPSGGFLAIGLTGARRAGLLGWRRKRKSRVSLLGPA
jgi:hypothetical protein